MPVIHRFGNLRGAKEKYKENVWYSIWYPLIEDDKDTTDDAGISLDFAEEDIDDAIALLQHLKTSEVNDYTESITDEQSQV